MNAVVVVAEMPEVAELDSFVPDQGFRAPSAGYDEYQPVVPRQRRALVLDQVALHAHLRAKLLHRVVEMEELGDHPAYRRADRFGCGGLKRPRPQ